MSRCAWALLVLPASLRSMSRALLIGGERAGAIARLQLHVAELVPRLDPDVTLRLRVARSWAASLWAMSRLSS